MDTAASARIRFEQVHLVRFDGQRLRLSLVRGVGHALD